MSLYSNILSYKGSDDKSHDNNSVGKSNASMKFLQDHLLAKQRSKQSSAPKVAQAKPNSQKLTQIISETSLHMLGDEDWDPEDEYDPMLPNSYEILQAQHLKMRELELQNRSNSSVGKLAVPNMLEMLDRLESEEASEQQEDLTVTTKKIKGTAIAPPPSLTASNNSPNLSSSTLLADPLPAKPVYANQNASSVAVKIMSKMGYKTGQGLGKDHQGMSEPLEVEKSGFNMGKILSAPAKVVSVQSNESISDKETFKTDAAATRVLLLQNMVGPGEVDDDLESETKEECKKYGSVIRCVIYEIPNKKVADHEAVRIFVEFSQVESAIKAMTDLNGTYFGGRIVRASFYEVNKFNNFDLGPCQ